MLIGKVESTCSMGVLRGHLACDSMLLQRQRKTTDVCHIQYVSQQ